jgi:hypothetical protein
VLAAWIAITGSAAWGSKMAAIVYIKESDERRAKEIYPYWLLFLI